MRTLFTRARVALLATVATLALLVGLGAVPAPTASATVQEAPCARSDVSLVKTVRFTRKSGDKTLKLDYATLKVWRVGASGLYCVQVGSEYKRKVWMEAGFCYLDNGKWGCGAGHGYMYLGNKYSFAENVTLDSGSGTAQTYRLRTASGKYYYAKTGWLYG